MLPVGLFPVRQKVEFSELHTGAGNSFLGGLAAGLLLTDGDVYEGP
jgi:hypothetical protein